MPIFTPNILKITINVLNKKKLYVNLFTPKKNKVYFTIYFIFFINTYINNYINFK